MDTIGIVIGNVCSILAMITDSISSTRKTAKGVIWVQSISQLIYFVGTIVLKGYSGAVQNAVSFIRNMVAIKDIKSKAIEWILVALGVVLGVAFNNLGLVGYLPVVANLQYTLAIFKFKDNERALKISFAISIGLFGLFNIFILNFVGAATNLFVMATTVVALIRKKAA